MINLCLSPRLLPMVGTMLLALSSLVWVSRMSWGQDAATTETTAATGESSEGDDGGSVFDTDSSDEVFEEYASLKRLAAAWKLMDSNLMTDAALQFADGERALLRSHKAIQATQVFELAIRLATENGDKQSLVRLAKALDRRGDKERAQEVNLAIQAAGASRAINPVLNEGSLDARLTIQAVQSEIQSARVAGSRAQLDTLATSLGDLAISDNQRAELKNSIAEAMESLIEDEDSLATVQLLDELGGIRRGTDQIEKHDATKFVAYDYPKGSFNETQIEAIMELPGTQPVANEGRPQFFPSELELLSRPSRGVISSGGNLEGARYRNKPTIVKERLPGPHRIRRTGTNIGMWEYRNYSGSAGNTCGQAAIATMLTYHSPKNFPPITTETYVENLYRGFGPDVALGLFGTGWDRLEKGAKANGLNTAWIRNTEIEGYVRAGYPVIVMLDIASDRAGWKDKSGGHWTIVYAVDDAGYYLSNWPDVSNTVCNWPVQREFFISGHTTWLTDKAGTSGWGLLTW